MIILEIILGIISTILAISLFSWIRNKVRETNINADIEDNVAFPTEIVNKIFDKED